MQEITKTIDDVLSLIPTEMQFLSLRTRIGNIKSSIQLDPNKMLKIGSAEFSKLIANVPAQLPWKQQIDAYLAKVRAGESPDVLPQQTALPLSPQPQPQQQPSVPPPPPPPQTTAPVKPRAYAWMAGKDKLGIANGAGVMVHTVDIHDGEDPRLVAGVIAGAQYDVEFVESPMLHEEFLRVMGYKTQEPQQHVAEKSVAQQSSPAPVTPVGKYLDLRAQQRRIQREIEVLEAELFGGL